MQPCPPHCPSGDVLAPARLFQALALEESIPMTKQASVAGQTAYRRLTALLQCTFVNQTS
jgi:hypothetical protein